MKPSIRLRATYFLRAGLFSGLFFICAVATAQITPPGYEREVKMREAQKQLSALDRDSMMVTDTVIVFDPTTYEQTITVVNTNYSLRDFCKNVLGMPDPDILLDGQPHTIIDPKDYGDMVVRLKSGKIEIVSD
ncbi:MAG TPA: hypothetical protein VLA46_12535 [Saprospiraceae bacterium]|nr:hypothetical protein [Saprospiraceae bacterium]